MVDSKEHYKFELGVKGIKFGFAASVMTNLQLWTLMFSSFSDDGVIPQGGEIFPKFILCFCTGIFMLSSMYFFKHIPLWIFLVFNLRSRNYLRLLWWTMYLSLSYRFGISLSTLLIINLWGASGQLLWLSWSSLEYSRSTLKMQGIDLQTLPMLTNYSCQDKWWINFVGFLGSWSSPIYGLFAFTYQSEIIETPPLIPFSIISSSSWSASE